MLQSLAISIILGLIQSLFKNPAKKEKLKNVLLEVKDAIELLYSTEEDQTVMRSGNKFYRVN